MEYPIENTTGSVIIAMTKDNVDINYRDGDTWRCVTIPYIRLAHMLQGGIMLDIGPGDGELTVHVGK